MKVTTSFALGLVSIALMAGCSTRYGALTVATTKNIDVNMVEFEKVQEGAVGRSTKPIILIIPTGTPSIEDAIDAALEAAGGDIMQNVVIYYKWYWIPYIYGEYTFEVKGDVWKLKNRDTGSLDKEILERAEKVYGISTIDGKLSAVEIDAAKVRLGDIAPQ